jgi:hypothetical protein
MRRVSWFAKPRPLTYEYALVCAATLGAAMWREWHDSLRLGHEARPVLARHAVCFR